MSEGTIRATIGQLGVIVEQLRAAAATNAANAETAALAAQALKDLLPPLHPLVGRTRSGLPWPSGVFTGNANQGPVEEFATWRGRPLDVLLWFATTSNWRAYNFRYPDYLRDFPGLRVISMGLVPMDGLSPLAAAARGEFDEQWRTVGRLLAERGFDDSRTMLRLGHEMNGNWYPWSARKPADYVAAYHRAVDAIRENASTMRFSWCLNKGTSRDSFWIEALPSDDHVDVYAIDPYDNYTPSFTDSQWQANCRRGPGLLDVVELTQAHGKMMALEEWACSERFTTANGSVYDGGGDNTFYVDKIWQFCKDNAALISHEIAYDDPGSAFHQRSRQPQAWARYRQLWGR